MSDEPEPATDSDATEVGEDLIAQDEWANCWRCEGVSPSDKTNAITMRHRL